MCQSLDVGDVSGWIANAFAVDGAGVLVDQLLDVFGLIGLSEFSANAALAKDMRE